MGSYRQLLSSYCYLIGCAPLIPGSYYLLDASQFRLAIFLYIFACAFLAFAALIDLIACLYSMPKNCEDEETTMSQKLMSAKSDHKNKMKQWLTQLFICIFYENGGILFLVASVLYWPDFKEPSLANSGTWVFRFGSFNYIAGSLICLKGVLKMKNSLSKFMWISVLVQYMLGSTAFITGGILSQTGGKYGTQAWLAGSVLFTGGALAGVIEVHRSWSKK